MIADMKATKIILDGCATFAAKCHDDMLDALKYGVMNSSTYSWSKWSSTKNDKTGIWTVVHKETGYTLRSHNRQKVEKKMARFHTAHVKLTWR